MILPVWVSLLLAGGLAVSVHPAAWRVTEGKLQVDTTGLMTVYDGKMRATIDHPTQKVAELRFRYLGPSKESYALASGLGRRQVGLKLRAADACNLIYVMWRFLPAPGIVVSVKNNPMQHRSKSCGARGYTIARPERATKVPEVVLGSQHLLRAELLSRSLIVQADGVTVWQGALPDVATRMHGPVGVRTDNGAFELQLSVSDG